jgi:hypothetical protein
VSNEFGDKGNKTMTNFGLPDALCEQSAVRFFQLGSNFFLGPKNPVSSASISHVFPSE